MRVWIETSDIQHNQKYGQVTLYVRVWIETSLGDYLGLPPYVTLYVRVWIETFKDWPSVILFESPST